MKDCYVYEAEYIRRVGEEHFLNIDLGLRSWIVRPVAITNDYGLKSGDQLLIKVDILEKTRHKPHKYICTILKKKH